MFFMKHIFEILEIFLTTNRFLLFSTAMVACLKFSQKQIHVALQQSEFFNYQQDVITAVF